MPNTYPITVNSTYGEAVNVYTTMSAAPTNPPSTDPSAYTPVYTLLGKVDANSSGNFSTPEPIARVVITRQSDEFPVKLSVVQALTPASQTIALAASDETTAQSGWIFFQTFSSQPYAPVSLNFSQMVATTDPADLVDTAATFFDNNGAVGVTFGLFSAISYWATNQLYAFPGTYYCYEPPTASASGFILPTNSVGQIVIANGTATYTPTGGSAETLSFSNTSLTSAGATASSGLMLTSILRDLTWEDKPSTITWGFVGTNDGQQFIAQSYADPTLPWYAVAYDLTYGAFMTVQIVMAVESAISLFKAAGTGLQWLSQNVGKLVDNIRDFANSTGDSAGADSAVGDDADPINVDVDIDIDIDVDVDVDIDIDIDVDVDVDIDIDIDVDFIAVVDVDVDVDVDIDIDVVTDTETDIDIDVDVDIDTEVDVEPGAINTLLGKVGNWIMTKAFPTLIEGAAIYVAFQSATKLLQAWKTQDEKGIANLQPRETTGLGLLINYMFNDQVSIADRWTTFSQYVEESQPDPTTLQVTISTILQTKNSAADAASEAWRWSTSDEAAAVSALSASTGTDTYKAFQTLGAYDYASKPLPLKTGCAVAMKYLGS